MDNNRISFLMKIISEFKKENETLRRLLKDNQIDISDEERSESYDMNQGARIVPVSVTKKLASQYFARFWGRMDVCSQRVVNKAGEIGYYPQCKISGYLAAGEDQNSIMS